MDVFAFVWCGICTIFSHFTCYVRKTESIKNHLDSFASVQTKTSEKHLAVGISKLGPPFYNVQYEQLNLGSHKIV